MPDRTNRLVAIVAVLAVPAVGGEAVGGEPVSSHEWSETDDRLVVHEWGTFTSFSGSDGVRLEFRPLIADGLPKFVLGRTRHRWFGDPGRAAWQRMDDPFVNFYTNRERTVRVSVRFTEGLLTDFYPPVADIVPAIGPPPLEKLPPSYEAQYGALLRREQRSKWLAGEHRRPPPKNSRLDWGEITLLPADEEHDLPQPAAGFAGHPLVARVIERYGYARETDAAYVHVHRPELPQWPHVPGGDFHEKFLFYRGRGDFDLPISVTAQGDDRFVLKNGGPDDIGPLFLVSVEGVRVRFRKYDVSAAERSLPVELFGRQLLSSPEIAAASLTRALVDAGLFEKEARALVRTWRDEWFGEQGTRLISLLPERLTNELLPLTVEPKPDETVRVLVGRVEILTPETERRIEELLAVLAENKERRDHTWGGQLPLPGEVLALGRRAEPALVRIKELNDDDGFRSEATLLLGQLRAHRRDAADENDRRHEQGGRTTGKSTRGVEDR